VIDFGRSRAVMVCVVWALLLACGLLAGGCAGQRVVDDRETSLRPPPRGFAPNRVVLSSTVPVDTTASGHADQFTVVAYLFGPMEQYPLPIWDAGVFEFEVRDPRSGDAVARWSRGAEATRSARQLLQPGPAFIFDLSLIEVNGMGSDVFPARTFELVARFHAESGARVESRPQPIRLGGSGRGRGSGAGSGG